MFSQNYDYNIKVYYNFMYFETVLELPQASGIPKLRYSLDKEHKTNSAFLGKTHMKGVQIFSSSRKEAFSQERKHINVESFRTKA